MRDRLRPVMGLSNLPFGLYGGVMLATIPQLLAAQGVPQPEIASVTAIGLSPGFFYFFVSPILDVRFSRKLYAYVLGGVTALLLFAALMSTANLTLLGIFLFSGQFAGALYTSALGGWLGSLVRPEDEARLGAWFTIGNFAGYGATAMVGILLLRSFPFVIGASLLSAMVLLPLLSFPFLPSSPPDRRLASESFGRFFADILALLRRPAVLGALPFFITPCASFALINTLSALGNDFNTSEETVATILGFGASVPAVGSLLVPFLTRYIALRPSLSSDRIGRRAFHLGAYRPAAHAIHLHSCGRWGKFLRLCGVGGRNRNHFRHDRQEQPAGRDTIRGSERDAAHPPHLHARARRHWLRMGRPDREPADGRGAESCRLRHPWARLVVPASAGVAVP